MIPVFDDSGVNAGFAGQNAGRQSVGHASAKRRTPARSEAALNGRTAEWLTSVKAYGATHVIIERAMRATLNVCIGEQVPHTANAWREFGIAPESELSAFEKERLQSTC
jgi:hypothetical protein